MDVTDSDHKPVRCIFSVEIARVDESIRRQEFREIIGSNEKVKRILEELSKIPETVVSTNNILLQNQDTSVLRITNKGGKDRALFEIICEGQCTIKEGGQASDHCPRGSFGFPRWLEVSPASGIIEAGHIVEISVHHDEYQMLEEYVDGVPQNSWCEYARDKEVILLVKVRGGGPPTTEAMKIHQVRVRHCSDKTIPPVINNTAMTRKGHQPNNNNNSLLHRSDFQPLSSSPDVVHHLRSLHSP